MGRFTLALVLLALVVPAGGAAGPVDRRHLVTASSAQVDELPVLQGEALSAINELRQSKGLRRLRVNRTLSQVAISHSVSMAVHGFFSHSGYKGSTFWRRISARYGPDSRAYWGVGETLAWASPQLGARQAIDLWLASPSHRRTLLTAAWRDIGLGAVHALAAPGVYHGRAVTILTADFGFR